MFSGIPQTDQQTFDKSVAVHTVLDLASYNSIEIESCNKLLTDLYLYLIFPHHLDQGQPLYTLCSQIETSHPCCGESLLAVIVA